MFYASLTARSYGDVDLGLKSHMKDWRTWDRTHDPYVTRQVALPLHSFAIFHIDKYLIKGLQTLHYAPPVHLHQASAITLLIN